MEDTVLVRGINFHVEYSWVDHGIEDLAVFVEDSQIEIGDVLSSKVLDDIIEHIMKNQPEYDPRDPDDLPEGLQ